MAIQRILTKTVARNVLSIIAVAGSVLLVIAVPGAVGMSWSAVLEVLAGLSLTTIAALAVLWFLGILTHTYVLTASLPGLSTRRALLLNLSGSSVANLVPFGGAAGIGLGFAMARTWRITPANFAAFTAISNLWNVFAKLLVGSILVLAAVVVGYPLPATMRAAILYGGGGILVLSAIVAVLLITPVMGATIGRGWDRVANRVLARLGSSRRVDSESALDRLRAVCKESISAGWAQLTIGVLAYMALQFGLLAACLYAVGAPTPLIVIGAAFGVDRLLSMFPLTPGGAGVSELGTLAILVGLGGDPTLMTAGVLLYRIYTFLLEIPVGGVMGIVWLFIRVQPPADSQPAPIAQSSPVAELAA